MNSVIGTTIGLTRQENQDVAVVGRVIRSDEKQGLTFAVLCDGVGGLQQGRACASLTVASFIDILATLPFTTPTNLIRQAISIVNDEVRSAYGGRGGTTIVGALRYEQQTLGFSVGDSRLYQISKSILTQISYDDTIAGELSRLRGETRPNEEIDPILLRLEQYIGTEGSLESKVYQLADFNSTDRLLLTTDGVHSVHSHTLRELVTFSSNSHTLVQRLIQLSKWRGGLDNATAISFAASDFDIKPTTSNDLEVEVWDSYSSILISSNLPPMGGSRKPGLAEEFVTDLEQSASKQKKARKSGSAKPVQQSSERKGDTQRGQRDLEIELLDRNGHPQRLSSLPHDLAIGEFPSRPTPEGKPQHGRETD